MTYSKYKCWKRQVKFTILGFSPLYCCYLLFQGQNSTYPVKVREAFWGSSLVAQLVKNLPAMQETPVKSLGQEDFLEKEMATHCSILAWEIPWIEEPGGLQPMGSQRVGHDWVTSLSRQQVCAIQPIFNTFTVLTTLNPCLVECTNGIIISQLTKLLKALQKFWPKCLAKSIGIGHSEFQIHPFQNS